MVIDAKQTWRHKHNNHAVTVIEANDGLVAFAKAERRLKWPVARFLVWYTPTNTNTPKAGQVWYSDSVGESCVIDKVNRFVWFRYATIDRVHKMTPEWFTTCHTFVSKLTGNKPAEIPPPEYDPNDVAFNRDKIKRTIDRIAGASQTAREADTTIAKAEEAMNDAEAAVIATVGQGIDRETLKALKQRLGGLAAKCESLVMPLRFAEATIRALEITDECE
jgi:hypothetical protein